MAAGLYDKDTEQDVLLAAADDRDARVWLLDHATPADFPSHPTLAAALFAAWTQPWKATWTVEPDGPRYLELLDPADPWLANQIVRLSVAAPGRYLYAPRKGLARLQDLHERRQLEAACTQLLDPATGDIDAYAARRLRELLERAGVA